MYNITVSFCYNNFQNSLILESISTICCYDPIISDCLQIFKFGKWQTLETLIGQESAACLRTIS